MNKVNRFLLIYIVVITVLCGYMYYAAFYKEDVGKNKQIHQVQSTVTEASTKVSVTTTEQKITYGLKIKDGTLVVINNHTKEVFEYTDMKKEDLPEDILEMLRNKTVFEDQEEVYHFLESYSSQSFDHMMPGYLGG